MYSVNGRERTMTMELFLDIGYKDNVLYTDAKITFLEHGIVSLIGENGSGKSTIYKTMMGMIPPIRGKIPNELLQGSAIVSDYVHIPEEITVRDVLDLLGKESVEYVRKNYIKIFDYVLSFKENKVKTLSSGQKRILEIFTVLSTKKKYIFLDEATNALDFKNKQLFLEYVKEISKNDVLFIQTTHNLNDVVYLEGKIYGLFKSRKKIIEYNLKEKDLNSLQKFLES